MPVLRLLAVERVLVGARPQEELSAEAIDAGAAICGGQWEGVQ
jgi:hypothetical protein